MPRGWRARPLPRGPMVALLHLFLHPYTSSSSHKHEYPAQTRVLAHFAAILDLLAQSTSHKTTWGDCSLVCDSSIGPISFYFSALFIEIFCCLGDCRCQNRRISGRGSRTVRLRRMVAGGGGCDVYPGSGPLDAGNTLLPA